MTRTLLCILATSLAALFCVPATAAAKAPHRHHAEKSSRHAHTHGARRHRKHHSRSHPSKPHHHKPSHPSTATPSSGPATASGYCAGANLTPEPGNLESVSAATLCLINGERARFGEQALITSAQLTSSATAHSDDMVANDYFEHVSPTGQTLLMRVRASGFIPSSKDGYELGENIAWGTLWLATPRSIVEAWMASPGHRANILDSDYRYTGIGVDPAVPSSLSEGQPGGMYTQDFGTVISS
jgi:uncharacterized protein YkwD